MTDARASAEDARKKLDAGVDPSAQRKADKQADEAQRKTFGEVVDIYLERVIKEGGREGGPASQHTIDKNTWLLRKLAKDLLPKAIRTITEEDGNTIQADRLANMLVAIHRSSGSVLFSRHGSTAG